MDVDDDCVEGKKSPATPIEWSCLNEYNDSNDDFYCIFDLQGEALVSLKSAPCQPPNLYPISESPDGHDAVDEPDLWGIVEWEGNSLQNNFIKPHSPKESCMLHVGSNLLKGKMETTQTRTGENCRWLILRAASRTQNKSSDDINLSSKNCQSSSFWQVQGILSHKVTFSSRPAIDPFKENYANSKLSEEFLSINESVVNGDGIKNAKSLSRCHSEKELSKKQYNGYIWLLGISPDLPETTGLWNLLEISEDNFENLKNEARSDNLILKGRSIYLPLLSENELTEEGTTVLCSTRFCFQINRNEVDGQLIIGAKSSKCKNSDRNDFCEERQGVCLSGICSSILTINECPDRIYQLIDILNNLQSIYMANCIETNINSNLYKFETISLKFLIKEVQASECATAAALLGDDRLAYVPYFSKKTSDEYINGNIGVDLKRVFDSDKGYNDIGRNLWYFVKSQLANKWGNPIIPSEYIFMFDPLTNGYFLVKRIVISSWIMKILERLPIKYRAENIKHNNISVGNVYDAILKNNEETFIEGFILPKLWENFNEKKQKICDFCEGDKINVPFTAGIVAQIMGFCADLSGFSQIDIGPYPTAIRHCWPVPQDMFLKNNSSDVSNLNQKHLIGDKDVEQGNLVNTLEMCEKLWSDEKASRDLVVHINIFKIHLLLAASIFDDLNVHGNNYDVEIGLSSSKILKLRSIYGVNFIIELGKRMLNISLWILRRGFIEAQTVLCVLSFLLRKNATMMFGKEWCSEDRLDVLLPIAIKYAADQCPLVAYALHMMRLPSICGVSNIIQSPVDIFTNYIKCAFDGMIPNEIDFDFIKELALPIYTMQEIFNASCFGFPELRICWDSEKCSNDLSWLGARLLIGDNKNINNRYDRSNQTKDNTYSVHTLPTVIHRASQLLASSNEINNPEYLVKLVLGRNCCTLSENEIEKIAAGILWASFLSPFVGFLIASRSGKGTNLEFVKLERWCLPLTLRERLSALFAIKNQWAEEELKALLHEKLKNSDLTVILAGDPRRHCRAMTLGLPGADKNQKIIVFFKQNIPDPFWSVEGGLKD